MLLLAEKHRFGFDKSARTLQTHPSGVMLFFAMCAVIACKEVTKQPIAGSCQRDLPRLWCVCRGQSQIWRVCERHPSICQVQSPLVCSGSTRIWQVFSLASVEEKCSQQARVQKRRRAEDFVLQECFCARAQPYRPIPWEKKVKYLEYFKVSSLPSRVFRILVSLLSRHQAWNAARVFFLPPHVWRE